MFLGVSESPMIWACASIRPGISVRPPASMTVASPASIGAWDTERIRSFCTRTLKDGRKAVAPSNTIFALVKSVSDIRTLSCSRSQSENRRVHQIGDLIETAAVPGIRDAVVGQVGEGHARIGIGPAVGGADATMAEDARAGEAAKAAHILRGAAQMGPEAAMHRHA